MRLASYEDRTEREYQELVEKAAEDPRKAFPTGELISFESEAMFELGVAWARVNPPPEVLELVKQLEILRDKLIQYAGPENGLYEIGDANHALAKWKEKSK